MSPTFITEADVNFWREKNIEIYSMFFIPITIYKLKNAPHDTLYGEDLNVEYEEPYTLAGYIPNLPGWKQLKTKFGTDEARNLNAFFSPDLAAKEGKPLPTVGDRIVIQNDTYYVSQENPEDYGSNLQMHLSWIVTLIRTRPLNPVQGTTIQKEY
jgi:hypothetical protein